MTSAVHRAPRSTEHQPGEAPLAPEALVDLARTRPAAGAQAGTGCLAGCDVVTVAMTVSVLVVVSVAVVVILGGLTVIVMVVVGGGVSLTSWGRARTLVLSRAKRRLAVSCILVG